MKKIYYLVIALLGVLSPGISHAAKADLVDPTTEISINPGTPDSVVVSIVTAELPKDYIYRNSFMWGGDESQPPRRIVKAINVARKKQKIFIPLSVYSDLGDPRQASLVQLPTHGFELTIVGGDAAGSYKASLEFKSNEIVRRKVVSGEFPKEVWEETRFSFNRLNN
jgi:hypothetical protein